VLQGLTDVDRPGQGLGDGERAPGERVQRPSDHEVHGQEEDSAAVEVGGAVVADGDDVGVGQARGDLCLAAEGRFLYRVPLPYQDDLEGDVVGLVEVLGAPHSAHASAADRLLQPVPVGDRRAAHQVLQPCVSELWGRPAPGAVGKGVPRCGGAYENALPGRGGAMPAPRAACQAGASASTSWMRLRWKVLTSSSVPVQAYRYGGSSSSEWMVWVVGRPAPGA